MTSFLYIEFLASLRLFAVMRVRLCVLLLSFLCGKALCDDDSSFSLYTEIKLANKSDSLNRIRNTPIVSYKFKYDSVSERRIMGVLGPDAQRWFPESIDIVPSYTVPNKDRTKGNTVLTNFPIVDKNVLFMHGIAALQELADRYDEMGNIVASLENIDTAISEKYRSIEEKMHAEVSLQTQEKLKIARLEKELSKGLAEAERIRHEEERMLVAKQLEEEKKLLEYEGELVRRRMEQEELIAKENLQSMLALEKELAEKREAMKRKTADQLQNLKMLQLREMDEKKLESEKEKIRLELEAKAVQDKINEDIAIRKIQFQSKQDTERMIQGIKAVSEQISKVVTDILAKPQQMLLIACAVLVLLLCYYLIRELLTMLRQFIQSRIGKPSLVRETSYHWSVIPAFVVAWFTVKEPLATTFRSIEDSFKHIILCKDDKERVINLAVATRNTRNSGAPYRHVLLHGPPGTGKTLIARKLAQVSGMDYAIMSGGDVAPLGEDAVNQLHNLFKWAARSRKGLLVFIDEAEAFLSSRSGTSGGGGGDHGGGGGAYHSSSRNSGDGSASGGGNGGGDIHLRNALNALLYQTGMPSANFMLVLATNRPGDIDSAILDRVDISLHIGLPGLDQRIDLVKLYMQSYVVGVVRRAQEKRRKQWAILSVLRRSGDSVSCVDDTCLTEDALSHVAIKTHGFSGREIAKLFIAVQYTMFLAEEQRLTLPLFQSTVATKVKDHSVKVNGFAAAASVSGAGSSVESKVGAEIHRLEGMANDGGVTKGGRGGRK